MKCIIVALAALAVLSMLQTTTITLLLFSAETPQH